MKTSKTIIEAMTKECWLSFNEGTAAVQSCFDKDKTAVGAMNGQRWILAWRIAGCLLD